MKIYLIIAAITTLLSSCLKQSIADAMLNKQDKKGVTATLSYEINGSLREISVNDAAYQQPGFRTLYCEKSTVYHLSAVGNGGEFVFTFFTDSLKVGNYRYTVNYGPLYVTTFGGYAQYVAGPTDYMNFDVTSHKDGHISGTFSGQLTPAILPGYPNNVYGTPGSVLIKKGSFNNVPVFY